MISIVSRGLISDQALGLSPQLKADLLKFNWIANVDVSNQLPAVWRTSPGAQTLRDPACIEDARRLNAKLHR